MTSSTELGRELAGLAEYLSTKHAAIVAAVHKAVQHDPRLVTGGTLPRVQFIDHLPKVLDAFEERLKAQTAREERTAARSETESAKAHGRHRWQQGYRLSETILEWRHLHECLLAEIERYIIEQQHALSAAAFLAATRELAELLGEGVSQSAEQHAQLHQAESTNRVRELSEAIQRTQAIANQRATTWREAVHDLRGSVGVVRTASAVLDRETLLQQGGLHSHELIKRGVASLTELLEELMDLARLEAGQEGLNVASFDAAGLLRELCAAMRPIASVHGLFLKAEGCDELVVQGDAPKVRRIAQNLLLNALKYTERGGVWVRWEQGDQAQAPRWTLTVQDTGPGLSIDDAAPVANELKEATDALQSGDDSAKSGSSAPAHTPRGEGLGLSIVKRLCELLDAGIELETTAQEGTTFRVDFPSRYPERFRSA